MIQKKVLIQSILFSFLFLVLLWKWLNESPCFIALWRIKLMLMHDMWPFFNYNYFIIFSNVIRFWILTSQNYLCSFTSHTHTHIMIYKSIKIYFCYFSALIKHYAFLVFSFLLYMKKINVMKMKSTIKLGINVSTYLWKHFSFHKS